MSKYQGILLLLLCLAGCGGATKRGPLFDNNLLLPVVPQDTSLVETSTTDGSRTSLVIIPPECRFKSSPEVSGFTVKLTESSRNQCIFALKTIIDIKYYAYRWGLKALATNTGAATDMVSLGLSTAATAVGGAPVKTVLSAINVGITGAKSSLSADYLYSKSIELAINQMDADRDQQFALMLKEMRNAVSSYGMEEAKNDLLKYYDVGTFSQAINSLQIKTGASANACEKAVSAAKTKNADVADKAGMSAQNGSASENCNDDQMVSVSTTPPPKADKAKVAPKK